MLHMTSRLERVVGRKRINDGPTYRVYLSIQNMDTISNLILAKHVYRYEVKGMLLYLSTLCVKEANEYEPLQMFLSSVYQSLHRPFWTRPFCLATKFEPSTHNISLQQQQKSFHPQVSYTLHPNMCQVTSSPISNAVIAAKGFLLGASAVAFFFVLEDLVSKGNSASSLRGGSNTPPTNEPALQGNSSNVEQEIRGINLPDINMQVPAASNEGQGQLSHVPSAAPSTPIPTYMPTAAGEIPTDMPTQFENDVNSSSLAKLRSNNEVGFRLKLYWETGYYWQESTMEKFWCMSSPGGQCERNDKLELRDCKKKSNEDAQFVDTSIGKVHQFRVINTNLCLQKSKRGVAVKLKPCNTRNKLQHFIGFKSDGQTV
jgi:hypothetical protein